MDLQYAVSNGLKWSVAYLHMYIMYVVMQDEVYDVEKWYDQV